MGDANRKYPLGYITAQGESSSTWMAPPLDGSMTFPEMLFWHGQRSASHPFCILAAEVEGEDSVVITWREASRAMFRLAEELRHEVGKHIIGGKPVVVGILAYPESLTYATWVGAITAAGYTAFPLSPRNSLAAYQHLLKATNCQYLVGSIPRNGEPGTALQQTTSRLLEELPDLKILDLPIYDVLYPRLGHWPPAPYVPNDDRPPVLEPWPVEPGMPVLIMHSSGSTAFPKPIPLHDDAWTTWGKSLWYLKDDICGTIWASMTLPLFHIAGLSIALSTSVLAGTVTLFFKPQLVPRIPTPQAVLQGAMLGKADYVVTVPSACVEWAQDPKSIAALTKLKALKYGGGPIPEEFGHRLVEAGVELHTTYGMTEASTLFHVDSVSYLGGNDWMYAPFMQHLKIELIDEGDNTFRAIVMETDMYKGVAVSNYKANVRAFDTNDLLKPHPIRKDYWKVVGRADDQIMMSNGEKTNPGPLESIINASPHVQTAIMFGRARTQVGVLIEPRTPVNLEDVAELASFRNLIWPEIEKANKYAPQHSRIFKELILVVDSAKKPIPRTAKGTVSRNALLNLFADEIDAIYTAAAEPTRAAWAVPPTTWDDVAIHEFVVRVVNGVMRTEHGNLRTIDENSDLFEQGCDSLQATYIRSAIANAVQQASTLGGKNDIAKSHVSQNLVFQHPTILGLASFVVAAIRGKSEDTAGIPEAIAKQMLQMAADYSQNLASSRSLPTLSNGGVVLLTGSTGALGTYILQQLLRDPAVSHVYALNRTSADKDLRTRQMESFTNRGVHVHLLESPKLSLIEGDTTKGDLGLSEMLHEEIRGSVTAVIHNAWRLDFNLSLSSFESYIKGTRNLVDLALSASAGPAHFIFTSSIGTLANWRSSRPVPEEALASPNLAIGTGYGESKWVAERVLLAAASRRGLRATIWRVGQLSGSTVNGAWNTTDWVPIMVQSGLALGALPSLPKAVVEWVPVDEAARAIVDSVHAPPKDGEDARYLHLIHPRPNNWDTIFGALAKHLEVPLVPSADWLAKLEHASESATPRTISRVPALKLLEFFHRAFGGTHSEHQETQYDTTQAQRVSGTLRAVALRPLGEQDVRRWMAYWRKRGLLD
ncbi:acetyl-CoA synthetase-like protein [Calocera cornea HHB12733]|uniref:Acetyl-CoA synthetase-like protein n=1 Tax=Calocera cornea HHB12733 TaxID=1353952 RepID=A0A165H0S6_9BASI|nr:acetyl-CoA synthetase-like protein [Calocera cornea HHB12733]